MDNTEKASFRRSASRIPVAAHFFGATAVVLLLVWLLHFRRGINLGSGDESCVFNVHPFLMVFGFIFFAGEVLLVVLHFQAATMAYKTIGAKRDVQKFSHMLLNLIAISLGIVGIYAAFKSHNMLNINHMYTLHSWMGMPTFCLFALQWLFGFALFLYPKASNSTRARALPWHVCIGRALLFMAICAAETGLMQKVTLLGLEGNAESRLINFVGLTILLFGIAVDLSVALIRYM